MFSHCHALVEKDYPSKTHKEYETISYESRKNDTILSHEQKIISPIFYEPPFFPINPLLFKLI